jgi:hypothetical protein
MCRLRVTGVCEPGIEGGEGTLALDAMPLLFVTDLFAHFFFERLDQVEGYVGGLEVFGIGVGDVVDE